MIDEEEKTRLAARAMEQMEAANDEKASDEEDERVGTPEDYRPEKFQEEFDYENADVVLSVRHLKQYFPFKTPTSKYLKAVHDVSFDVYRGEVFGLVGESGCGKTTTGRAILRVYNITSGDIWLDGVRISAGTRWNEKEIKWTGVRARNRIKELEREKSEAYASFSADYEHHFGSKPNIRTLKRQLESDPDLADREQKQSLLDEYEAKIAPLDEEIKKVREHAQEVRDVQMDNIRAAKRDNKNVNRRIAEHEVERVKAEYEDLLAKLETTPESELSPTEAAQLKECREKMEKAKKATLQNKVQMIFQDPIASLDPRMTVRNIIAEGLVIQGGHSKEYINSEVARVLKLVGLVPEHANRYPHEFSGGQRQRIGIARAIIMNPELIVADEPVSALDVSVQAQIINLLNNLRNSMHLSIIFIAHNLSVVKYFCDRIAVMYYGNLVELASSDELFAHPLHPYTISLLSAVPYPDPVTEASRTRIIYDPAKEHDYSKQKPTFREIAPGHFVRCNDEEEARYRKKLKEAGVSL